MIVKNGKKQSRKKIFNDILYSQCWEDPQMDRNAFQINSDDTVFSITSGGCNVLTFLLDNPRKVIALDLNPYQNYLLEFKIAAFKKLNYNELLEILGIRKSQQRIKLYYNIESLLSNKAREYWNNNFKKINHGIIHCGRYEKYMRLLRVTLGFLISKSLFRRFFEIEYKQDRIKLYAERWDNLRWRFFTRVLLSKRTMSLLFDKDFFKYLGESFSFGKHFAYKVEIALTSLAQKENYFLFYVLLGKFYGEKNLPYYLRKENFDLVRNRVDRIEIITSSCEEYFSSLTDSSISKFNFTNIFEWMAPDVYEKLLRETIRVAEDKAIITYRNLLVPREHPASLDKNISSLKNLAETLHKCDKSFIYNNYVIEVVQKDIKKWNTKQYKLQPEKL